MRYDGLVASGRAMPGVAASAPATALVNAGTGSGIRPDTVRPVPPRRPVTRYRRAGAPATGGR